MHHTACCFVHPNCSCVQLFSNNEIDNAYNELLKHPLIDNLPSSSTFQTENRPRNISVGTMNYKLTRKYRDDE